MSKEDLVNELSEKIKKIEERELACRKQLGALADERNEAKLTLINLVFGLKIGSVVTDRDGKEYQVYRIESRFWGYNPKYIWKPSIYGHPRRKDGTFGKAERYISNWDLVKP